MTQQHRIQETDAATNTALVQPAALQEIKIYSHSTLLYWWPAWAFGFLFALLNAGQEQVLAQRPKAIGRVQRSVSPMC